MSQISEKSPKHCANKNTINFNKKFLYYFSTFFLTILAFILLVWFINHPKKPQFTLNEAIVKQFKLSGLSKLNSSIDLTLITNNPNKNAGIYYDKLVLYTFYNDQKITPDFPISSFYQQHGDIIFLSAALVGNQQHVSLSLADEIQQDTVTAERVVLNFKVVGKLRWKIGTWVSGKHRFIVNCITIMPFGQTFSPRLASKQGTAKCSTTVL